MRLIDADKLKAHYAWWGDDDQQKQIFDDIVDRQPTVTPKSEGEEKAYLRGWKEGRRQLADESLKILNGIS